MLVLSRKHGQDIILTRGDDRIVVRCIRRSGSAIRIGIDATDEWRIERAELADVKPAFVMDEQT